MIMEDTSVKYQYYATFCANIITLAHGAAIGWTSPSLPILLSPETSPLSQGAISSDEASWIGALFCVGAIIGTVIFGWMADRLGRKLSSCIIALPQIAFWLCIIFAKDVIVLYIARISAGIAGGGVFVLVPLYVSEIAEDKIRGSLSSILIFAVNMGTLLSFIAGNYLSYIMVPTVMLFLPIVFVICFVFLPETPQFLISQGKIEEAEKALRYLRGLNNTAKPEHFKVELEKLSKLTEECKNQTQDTSKITWSDFTTGSAKRAIIIGIALVAFNQFSGCFALINYTAQIFVEAGSDLSANMSAIVVGVIQIVGSYASTALVDKAGRKILYIVSALSTGLGLAVMGTYSYLKTSNINLTGFGWIPIASLSFIIFIASIGILPLAFVILAEILPQKIRSSITSLCMTIMWIFAFFVVKYFSLLSEVLGMYGSMWLFSGCCFIGAVFCIFFVPETKGKSLENIIKELGGL